MKTYSMPFWWATYEQVFIPYQQTKASGYPKFRHQNQHILRVCIQNMKLPRLKYVDSVKFPDMIPIMLLFSSFQFGSQTQREELMSCALCKKK